MKRRTLIKSALALPVAAQFARLPVSAAATGPTPPVVGCPRCDPSIHPLGAAANDPDRLPLNDRHFAANWMRVPKDGFTPPTITVNGRTFDKVYELMTGPDGWIVRAHQDPAIPDANKTHFCTVCQDAAIIEVWRGNVVATGIDQLSHAEIMAGRHAAKLRDLRWQAIDLFTQMRPEWAEQIWKEQRQYPGMSPVMRRDVYWTGEVDGMGYKIKRATEPYYRWEKMPEWPIE